MHENGDNGRGGSPTEAHLSPFSYSAKHENEECEAFRACIVHGSTKATSRAKIKNFASDGMLAYQLVQDSLFFRRATARERGNAVRHFRACPAPFRESTLKLPIPLRIIPAFAPFQTLPPRKLPAFFLLPPHVSAPGALYSTLLSPAPRCRQIFSIFLHFNTLPGHYQQAFQASTPLSESDGAPLFCLLLQRPHPRKIKQNFHSSQEKQGTAGKIPPAAPRLIKYQLLLFPRCFNMRHSFAQTLKFLQPHKLIQICPGRLCIHQIARDADPAIAHCAQK